MARPETYFSEKSYFLSQFSKKKKSQVSKLVKRPDWAKNHSSKFGYFLGKVFDERGSFVQNWATFFGLTSIKVKEIWTFDSKQQNR